jgi:hypothetical protein
MVRSIHLAPSKVGQKARRNAEKWDFAKLNQYFDTLDEALAYQRDKMREQAAKAERELRLAKQRLARMEKKIANTQPPH